MNQENHHHLIDKLALLNGLISGVTLYPQIFILLSSETKTSNLSQLSFWLILLNSVIWLLYGSHRKNLPLVISSLLNIVAAGLILILILWY